MRKLPALLAVLLVASSVEAQDGSAPVGITIQGEAVLLTEVLTELKLTVDDKNIVEQVVLRTESGEVLPLLSDPGSRALFIDERLRGKPLEVQARRFQGLPYLQVTLFKIRVNEKYLIPEYYCDICTISVRYPQVCPCCQGDMELRMAPEDP